MVGDALDSVPAPLLRLFWLDFRSLDLFVDSLGRHLLLLAQVAFLAALGYRFVEVGFGNALIGLVFLRWRLQGAGLGLGTGGMLF